MVAEIDLKSIVPCERVGSSPTIPTVNINIMSILGSGYIAEGYYEEDGYGYTIVDNIDEILKLKNEGKLYRADGMGVSKVDCDERIISTSKYFK